MKTDLIRKIETHEAIIGVVGLGYVGLPLVLRFGAVGFNVLGFDVDPGKVEQLNAGKSYIGHIEGTKIRGLRESGRFEATVAPGALIAVSIVRECSRAAKPSTEVAREIGVGIAHTLASPSVAPPSPPATA